MDIRDSNIIKAKTQVKYMDTYFKQKTKESIREGLIYTGPLDRVDWTDMKNNPAPRIQVLNMGTAEAIIYIRSIIDNNNEKTKVCALNFASFRNPGGNFIGGSNAQEENLCHVSNLYNILREYSTYYRENTSMLNRNLYKDRAIYSPNVVFNDENKQIFVEADVLTCAAPNWSAAQNRGVSAIENKLVLAQRLQFIKDIAELETVDVLILGAWGCGVFKQDPRQVAKICDFIFSTSSIIKHIIYAVPGEINGKNYKAFVDCIHANM